MMSDHDGDDERDLQPKPPQMWSAPPPLPVSSIPPKTPSLNIDPRCALDQNHPGRKSTASRWPKSAWFVVGLVTGTALLVAIVALGSPSEWTMQALNPTPTRIQERIAQRAQHTDPVNAAIRRLQEQNSREPCDRDIKWRLGSALYSAGHKRRAAATLATHAERCTPYAAGLQRAASIYLELEDFDAAYNAASQVIATAPFYHNGFYLRGLASDGRKQFAAAVDDYATTIELFANKQNISSIAYEKLARAYENAGRPCDAAAAINQWVYLDPSGHDTSQTRRIIRDYRRSGRCSTASSGVFQVPMKDGTSVIKVKAKLNGTAGVFVVDTGASFVTLGAEFAARAGLAKNAGGRVRLQTANGVVEARRSHAREVVLGPLKANQVPVLVDWATGQPYGTATDGLLGMSFLSRFDLRLADGGLSIREPQR